MADSRTTHLNLIKQDTDAAPDYEKDHSNLDTLDNEIWARAKTFNGQPVGDDGGFHVQTVPLAENLYTSSGQTSDDNYIIRTTGGAAPVGDGNAWLTSIRGTYSHTGHADRYVNMAVMPVERGEGVDPITADIDEDEFFSSTHEASPIILTYGTGWSDDLSNFGITVNGTAIAGDVITITYANEVPGTITQSNPQKFVSTGWNLYDDSKKYARVLKYSDEPGEGFMISGSYNSLTWAANAAGTDDPRTIIPVSGHFTIPADGYLLVTGGNSTNTQIWMTWSDWDTVAKANNGVFEPYVESVIDLSAFMAANFPYGLLAVGTVQDEINLNTGFATSKVERLTNNSTNMETAVNSGRQYEYDEDFIYLERATPYPTYEVKSGTPPTTITGDYYAYDHGMELFTGTEQNVHAQTLYGANLKNKLEKDVLTISQQTLSAESKQQVCTNLGLGTAATSTVYNDIDKEAEGFVLDARQGKALYDMWTYNKGDNVYFPIMMFGYAASSATIYIYLSVPRRLLSTNTLTTDFGVSGIRDMDGTAVTIPSSGMTITTSRHQTYVVMIKIAGLSGLTANKSYRITIDGNRRAVVS